MDVRGSCGGDMRWELMEEMRGTSGNLVGDAFTIALLGAVVHGENTTNSIFIWPFFHTGVTIADPLLNWLSAIPFICFRRSFLWRSPDMWYCLWCYMRELFRPGVFKLNGRVFLF